MNVKNKDVTEILDLLDEYKRTYNTELFNEIKQIEKENIKLEGFTNIKKGNNTFLLLGLILLLYFILNSRH